MNPSVLHIEGYHLKELFIELNEGFAKKAAFGAWSGYHYQLEKSIKIDPVNFKVESEIGRKYDDPFSLRHTLKISSVGSKSKVPYSFRISLVGYFHLDKEYAGDDANVLLYANAPSLLYSAAREVLASATARGPYPAVILPAVTFVDDAKKLAAEDAKETLPLNRRSAKTKKEGRKSHARKATKK